MKSYIDLSDFILMLKDFPENTKSYYFVHSFLYAPPNSVDASVVSKDENWNCIVIESGERDSNCNVIDLINCLKELALTNPYAAVLILTNEELYSDRLIKSVEMRLHIRYNNIMLKETDLFMKKFHKSIEFVNFLNSNGIKSIKSAIALSEEKLGNQLLSFNDSICLYKDKWFTGGQLRRKNKTIHQFDFCHHGQSIHSVEKISDIVSKEKTNDLKENDLKHDNLKENDLKENDLKHDNLKNDNLKHDNLKHDNLKHNK